MTLHLKHFDTRTGQWINIPNPNKNTQRENPNIILDENLDNTLLEAFLKKEFPNKDYSNSLSIGHLDSASTPEDLYANHHPNGDVLLLSNGQRLLYGPAEIKGLINKLNPDTMHNGAYGSLFTGECENNYQGEVTFLVVDDSNGQNGGYIDDEQAWKLVGDCHGKINPIFSQELSSTTNEVIQFRLGNLSDGLYGKGTLAPKALSSYFKDKEVGNKVAFIIPTSSFKGAGKGTVEPGLYTKNIWLGEKEKAKKGEIALSQLLPSYPNALKDFIPRLEEHLDKLNSIIQDPRLLAQHYCTQYERREQKKDENWQPPTPDEAVERYRNYQQKELKNTYSNDNDDLDSGYEDFIYLALKADPNHYRLLESKKFSQALQEFVRKDYLNSAIGKLFKFDRAMIIPSKDLKTGEICVPWMNEGEKVLNFRSPFLNHNGMIHSTNKYVEDMYAPDGNNLKGVIVVNDEDYNRIVQRTILEAKTINPNVELIDIPEKLNQLSVQERIAFTNQLNEAFKQAEIDLFVPYESDCERMAADFDGDCMGVASAEIFPYLTQDVIEKSQPINLFRPTRKEDKLSFPEGTDFEVMAIHQSDGISVGSINNSVTTFSALLSEQEIYEQYGTPTIKQQLATRLIEKAQGLLKQENQSKKSISIPEFLHPQFAKLASYDTTQTLGKEQLQEVFAFQRDIYRKMVEEGCYQNQIAVDLFKSARVADKDSITNLTKLLYRQVDYFKQKKDYNTYRNEILETKGFSPTELTASLVNAEFKENQLTTQPPEQFKNLFPNNYTSQQILEAKQIKANYDTAYNLASAYNRKQKLEDDTHIKVTTKSGKTLEIVNYKRFISHGDVGKISQQPVNLRLINNTNPKTKSHQLIAQYQSQEGWKNLGLVCEIKREQYGLKAGLTSGECQLKIAQSIGKKEVQLLFNQAKEIALDWRSHLEANLSPEELSQYAKATWHLCHNHSNDTTNNFVYSAFGDKILEQISDPNLQFSNLLVGKLKHHNEVPESIWKSNEVLDFQLIEQDGEKVWQIFNPEQQEYQSFGVASQKDYQLPVGTKVKGKIHGDLFTTARLDIDHPQLKDREIIVGNMVKYPKVGFEFRNEQATIVLSQNNNPPPQPIITVNGKKLGQLDSNAVALFKEHNLFRNGLTFEATLNSYGEGNAREIIATTQQGTSLKIEKSNFLGNKELKETEFSGEKIQLTLSLEVPKKKPMIAHIKQTDGTFLPIGEFTTNQKASKEALSKVGLYREGATFKANITSRVTAARIEKDPHSIEYPKLGQWQTFQPQITIEKLNPTTAKLLETITTQPTLLHQFEQQWQQPNNTIKTLPTLGLSVDFNLVSATKDFFENQNIPYTLVYPDDPRVSLETERSYGVFWVLESNVPQQIRQAMEEKLNQVYDGKLSAKTPVSSYHEKLVSILPLPKKQQQERIVNSQAVFNETANLSSPSLTPPLSNTQSINPSENSLPSLPLSEEFMAENIALQQERTSLVAPVIMGLLEVKRLTNAQGLKYDQNSNTLSYRGKENTIIYDGQKLQLIDHQSGQPKMIAQHHQNSSGNPHWSAINLPINSPGLSVQDVNKFTNPEFVHKVKQAINEARQQTQQNSVTNQKTKAISR